MFELNSISWYNLKEVCAMLSLHPSTVRRYVKEKRLKASFVAKSFLFAGPDIQAFIESGAGKLGPAAGLKRKPPAPRKAKRK